MTSIKSAGRNGAANENDCTVCSNNPYARMRGVVCDDCVVNMNLKVFNQMINKRRYVHEMEADEHNWHYDYEKDAWHYQDPDLHGIVNGSVLRFTDDEIKRMKKVRQAAKQKNKLLRKTKKEVKQKKQLAVTAFFNPSI